MIRRLRRLAAGAALHATAMALVACNAGSSLPNVSQTGASTASAVHPRSLGGGQYTAQAPPGHPISMVIGSFPFVTGVKSVSNSPKSPSGCGANCFEITLNTTTFTPRSCGKLPHCTGSQQFVYSNPSSGSGSMWIANYLYGPDSPHPQCPAGFTASAYYCTSFTTYSGSIPNLAMNAANLKSVQLTASAAKNVDKFALNVGKKQYAVQQKDVTGLAGRWYGVWFDVTGGSGSANFNFGSTITFRLQTDTGLTTPPGCGLYGSYGPVASNNLTLTLARPRPAKAEFPSIWFTESNVSAGGSSSCEALGSRS